MRNLFVFLVLVSVVVAAASLLLSILGLGQFFVFFLPIPIIFARRWWRLRPSSPPLTGATLHYRCASCGARFTGEHCPRCGSPVKLTDF